MTELRHLPRSGLCAGTWSKSLTFRTFSFGFADLTGWYAPCYEVRAVSVVLC
jgi:hypothetical protein